MNGLVSGETGRRLGVIMLIFGRHALNYCIALISNFTLASV